MSKNIYSPAIPYLDSIPGVIGPGFTINIKGTIPPSCSWFGINLQCGPNICPRDDVLLHVGVDFIRGCVIRNSIHNNNWGPEEIQQGHFPFAKGAPFVITVICESTHFNILVNNLHFVKFEHRIVFHRGSHLAIDGDVILENVEMKSVNGSQSGLYPPVPGINPNMSLDYPAPYPTTPGMPLPTSVSTMYPPSPSPFNQVPSAPQYGNQLPSATQYGIPQSHMPHSPHFNASAPHGHPVAGQKQGVVGNLLNKIGAGGIAATAATAATAGVGYLGGKKAWKAQKKARKKALKYGLPIAGVGLGAYAISKAWSSSSSSSSSDEE